MALILDIETIGEPTASASIAAVSHAIKRAVHDGELRGATSDDVKRAAKIAEAEATDRLALSPWTGRVVVVAAWDTEKEKGICLVDTTAAVHDLPPGFVPAGRDGEVALVASAWRIIRDARQIVTWNGIDFDVPFLVGRALTCHVGLAPWLLRAKPWEDAHIDLCARTGMGFKGRARLETACLAMGIPSPKDAIDGSQVSEAWAAGRRADVARYCCGDVIALRSVWDRWVECTGSGNG